MMGRHLVSVNCCEDLTLPILNQFVSGMIQSGSWVHFNNIDRLSQGQCQGHIQSSSSVYFSSCVWGRLIRLIASEQPRFVRLCPTIPSLLSRASGVLSIHLCFGLPFLLFPALQFNSIQYNASFSDTPIKYLHKNTSIYIHHHPSLLLVTDISL